MAGSPDAKGDTVVTRSPALIERLVQIAQAAASAQHGGKEAVYAAACAELGMSRATLLRGLKEVTVKGERKRRSDAGETSLKRDEAALISAFIQEGMRKNAKRLVSLVEAVDTLRRTGQIRAEFVDGDGVIRPMSISAISRALRTYKLHPDQLLRPAPAVEMRSLHPNHVWEVDASLCVLFYIKGSQNKDSGLRVADHDTFYKNKPANLDRIALSRVWRYAITEHYSGTTLAHYVLGAESGINLAEALIWAMQPKDGRIPMHGVPFGIYCDPGSANTAGTTKNLLRRLGVRIEAHAPRKARATGQVENAQNIIETHFEAWLRFAPKVESVEELNALATVWMASFNSTRIHSRTGKTRFAVWQGIQPEQLRIPPSVEMCRTLLTHAPEKRQVNDWLRVEFGGQGRQWDVSQVPGVMVGEKLNVTWNPYDNTQVFVVEADQDGHETLYPCPLVERMDDDGRFRSTANVFFEDYARPADTIADKHRKEVAELATGSRDLDEADKLRRQKGYTPFGGRINPFDGLDTDKVEHLPRRGTDLPSTVTVTTPPPVPPRLLVQPPTDDRVLSLFEVARWLVSQGVQMTPERNALVAQWHPQGVAESALGELKDRLERPAPPSLRVVNGGV